jgi:uncharacterized protein (DUF433 family)
MASGVEELIARLGSGIESTPGLCGGAPRIAGTRIAVWTLEQARRLGASEADLLRDHPELRAADLVSAWTYVAAHRDEVEAQLRANEAAAPVAFPLPAYAAAATRALTAGELASAETPPGRPFLGYDRERAAYARLKPGLLAHAPGKYVVLVGEEVEGPVDTFGDALRAGWRRFGLGPLYVKQVLAEESPFAEVVGGPSWRS